MNIRLLVDEDFDYTIVRGLLRRLRELDLVRVQDVALSGKHDRVVLEWAAQENRILLTHDVSTMKNYAYERLEQGLPMPGVFAIHQFTPTVQAIESLILIIECSDHKEWENQIRFLPL